MTTQAGTRSRRTALLLTVAVAVVPAEIVGLLLTDNFRANWSVDFWARPVIVAQVVSTAAAAAGGAVLVRRRPANRCGVVAIALAVVWAAWFVSVYRWNAAAGGWRALGTIALLFALRPLLLYLVLAFPVGRLDRLSRRLYLGYVTVTLAVFLVTAVVYDPTVSPQQQFTVWRNTTWAQLVFSLWWDVVAFAVMATVLVVVRRRTTKFPGPGARIAAPAFWAAALATGADFLLILTGPIQDLFVHDGLLTPFGTTVQLIDYLRFGGVVALLAFGAWRAWPAERAAARDVDLGASRPEDALAGELAHVLGDPGAGIALVDATGTWRDLAGNPRTEPGPGRAVTILTQDDIPVAALEYDDAFAPHPALVEAAAAALALQIEAAQQTVVAQDREAQLRRLARDVLETEDTARNRLERDLHDGAQQALVGLSLHAALAARANGGASGGAADAARDLADAIDATRAELAAIASGRPPALLAERGLDGALGALVLTAGLPVSVAVDSCADLPERLQRAIWFTTSEAVTNALKHADASELRLTLRRTNDHVRLSIEDDGRGGVTETPAALATRVAEVDGSITVASNETGTRVVVEFATAVTP